MDKDDFVNNAWLQFVAFADDISCIENTCSAGAEVADIAKYFLAFPFHCCLFHTMFGYFGIRGDTQGSITSNSIATPLIRTNWIADDEEDLIRFTFRGSFGIPFVLLLWSSWTFFTSACSQVVCCRCSNIGEPHLFKNEVQTTSLIRIQKIRRIGAPMDSTGLMEQDHLILPI